eukprot:SAG11_NODE_2963_length_2807_cov_4.781019_3_plen_75_part_00
MLQRYDALEAKHRELKVEHDVNVQALEQQARHAVQVRAGPPLPPARGSLSLRLLLIDLAACWTRSQHEAHLAAS